MSHVKHLQKDAEKVLFVKDELEKILQQEKETSIGREKEIQKLEIEIQNLEFSRETLGAKMEESKTLSEDVFYGSLEREKLRWKQSSDEIIFDLMWVHVAVLPYDSFVSSQGYETELFGTKAALQEARDFRLVTELSDKSSQVRTVRGRSLGSRLSQR